MISSICICGAGTMGSGIAQVAAQSGYQTILFDVNNAMLEKAKAAIERSLAMLADKGKITPAESAAIAQRIIYSPRIEDCKANLVIEAIVEQADAKRSLFEKLEAINERTTIFATNTSSLPVSAIAQSLQNPGRMAGMHFFNPAPVMKLVEIVKGNETSDDVMHTLVAVAGAMGKTAVVCSDAPGFIVNRVARHYYLEAMKLAYEGIAGIETIDQVLENAGFKMGPFKLMDMIGLDINYGVSNIVWEALQKPERLTPSPMQKAKVDAGELGRKTGKGFYSY